MIRPPFQTHHLYVWKHLHLILFKFLLFRLLNGLLTTEKEFSAFPEAKQFNQWWLLHTVTPTHKNREVDARYLIMAVKKMIHVKRSNHLVLISGPHIIRPQLLYHNFTLVYEVLMLGELSRCQWYFFSRAATCQQRGNPLKVILTLQRPFG